jgi:hypothetical protein
MASSLMSIFEVEPEFKRIRNISSLDDLFTCFDGKQINGNIPLSIWK